MHLVLLYISDRESTTYDVRLRFFYEKKPTNYREPEYAFVIFYSTVWWFLNFKRIFTTPFYWFVWVEKGLISKNSDLYSDDLEITKRKWWYESSSCDLFKGGSFYFFIICYLTKRECSYKELNHVCSQSFWEI